MSKLTTNTINLQSILETINNLPDEGNKLPTLTNPGTSDDLLLDKQLIDSEGNVVNGAFTIDEELTTQDALITQIQNAVDNLPEMESPGASVDAIFHPYYMIFLNNSIPSLEEAELLSVSKGNDLITINYAGAGHDFFGIETIGIWQGSRFNGLVEGTDYDIVDTDDMSYVTIENYPDKPFAIFCMAV